MSVVTYEGIVEHGQIRLKTDVHLPEQTKVYVVVPDVGNHPIAHIFSPRLVNPQQVVDFSMEVVEEPADTGL